VITFTTFFAGKEFRRETFFTGAGNKSGWKRFRYIYKTIKAHRHDARYDYKISWYEGDSDD
jgi:hypothetical protein